MVWYFLLEVVDPNVGSVGHLHLGDPNETYASAPGYLLEPYLDVEWSYFLYALNFDDQREILTQDLDSCFACSLAGNQSEMVGMSDHEGSNLH